MTFNVILENVQKTSNRQIRASNGPESDIDII